MHYNGYLNVYVVLEIDHELFYIYYTAFTDKDRISLMSIESHSKNEKFMTIKDSISKDNRLLIKIIALDNFPTSYIKNNEVLGVERYFIDEFVTKLNTSYINVHSGDRNPSLPMLISYMSGPADICLCPQYNFLTTNFETVWLYEFDGVCLLVPRNIHVSNYDNFSSGMDRPTVFLAIISTFLVSLTWKLISLYSEQRLSTLQILYAVVRLAFFNSAYDLNRMSLKEKLLIFSFIFASFFMANLYESAILSFMMTDTTVRSARNLEELNSTDTIFHSFFDDYAAHLLKIPTVKKDLILNHIDLSSSYSLELPSNVDINLIYMVTCRFAENFVMSAGNYRNDYRLYDVLIMTKSYQFYTAKNGFMYIDEFSSLVTATLESGIRSYWTKETYRLSGDFSNVIKNEVNEERKFVEFRDMAIPAVVLLVGSIVALLEFVAEIIYHHGKIIKSKRSKVAPLQISRTITNLHKWADKYSKKEQRSYNMLSSREDVSKVIMNKKREIMKLAKFPEGKLKSGYLVPKKFKQRIRRRNIKVSPINAEIGETEV
ncbi:hypothetical protein ACKWTF_008807 [Chironomus riparius]